MCLLGQCLHGSGKAVEDAGRQQIQLSSGSQICVRILSQTEKPQWAPLCVH